MHELGERIRALPGAERLLPALEPLAPTWLVGGAVRDLLLGADHVDLDVVVEGDARAVARALAELLGGEAKLHERFGTATLRAGDLVVDLASARTEHYAYPGALPAVEPAGSLDEDLARRDFTVNAMAASLQPPRIGELHDPHRGREDLDARLIRVLHPASFQDDPTRLLRAVRYEARLDGALEPETERLARQAIEFGAIETVSGARIGAELLDLLHEAPGRGVARMAELGLDQALAPELAGADPALVEAAAGAAAAVGAQRRYAALAALVLPDSDGLADWLDTLHLRAEDRTAVLQAARKAPGLVRSLAVPLPDSSLHALLHCELPEVLALALALGAREEPVRRYVETLSGARLLITGDDLRAAGVPESPAIGRALEETLKRKLDGELGGREAELACALEVIRELSR